MNRIKDEKYQNAIKEYQEQYCSNCGHTLMFNIKQKTKVCNWCRALNYNQTKGHFLYNFYKATNQKYKTIRIKGDMK